MSLRSISAAMASATSPAMATALRISPPMSLRLIQATSTAPAIIVGHSLGARNGVVAATYAKRVGRGVVAIEFTPFIEPEVLETLEKRVNGGNRAFASKDEIISYLSARYPLMPQDAVARRAAYGYVEHQGVFRPLADPIKHGGDRRSRPARETSSLQSKMFNARRCSSGARKASSCRRRPSSARSDYGRISKTSLCRRRIITCRKKRRRRW